MRNLEGMVRRNLVTILLLLLLGGFVMLLAELLLTDHVDGIQNVAVIASAVGAVAIAAGFFVKGTLRHLTALLLLVLSLSGLMGAWQHFEASRGDEAHTPGAALVQAQTGYQTIAAGAGERQRAPQQEGEEENEGGEGRESGEGGQGAPPPLAPLSLSGLALMGAVVLLARQDD